MGGELVEDGGNRGGLTVCVILATLMQALDTTIANVALPYMQGSVAASQDQIAWVLTSYIVAAAIMTPPTGFLAGRFGLKRLFIVAIGGFTFASMLCGMAQSLNQIVLFRILQGAFGASLVPLSQTVLLGSYPRERQGFAMALFGIGVMIGPVLGPVIGGWLTENYSWRYVFYINLPIGLLDLLGIMIFLPNLPRNAGAKLDWFGFGTLSITLGALQLMLDRGEQLDWFGSGEIVIEASTRSLPKDPLCDPLFFATAILPPAHSSSPSSVSPITPQWRCNRLICRSSWAIPWSPPDWSWVRAA
jgi:DHA2 family multidrug resistance protein